ncbi:MAG TPA: helix-hairpin-helix domain-containing protein [Bacteroidetes bacterium]|nr:helix-hairpin-helix domain-containing protein [Bacteroidota bacterium]
MSPEILAFEKQYLQAVQNEKKRLSVHAPKRISSGMRIDLNKAAKEQLILLPGIGIKTAERIISFRETHGSFRNKKELMKIKGIGKKKFEALLPYLK